MQYFLLLIEIDLANFSKTFSKDRLARKTPYFITSIYRAINFYKLYEIENHIRS